LLLLLLTLPAAVQAQFNYTTNNGAITITKYTGSGSDVTIPDTTNNLTVTSIGQNAFINCPSLTSVKVGNSVTSIGNGAFEFCKSLTNVTISRSVTNIGNTMFAKCGSLTAIAVDALNSVYSSVNGVLFDKNQTTLIQCPGGSAGSYTVPNGVTSIGNGAFDFCISLTNVTISGSVTNIGSWAFFNCTNLTSFTIPKRVTSIGEGVFWYCTSLAAITVDALNPAYSSVDGVLFDKSQATLIQCPGGRAGSYTVPNGVTGLGNFAFINCCSVTNVTIGNSVTNIGNGAFALCTNLTGVYFKGNAPSADSSVFFFDNNATVYYLPGTTNWGATFGGRPTKLWKP
jgi:hypothetical protein